MIRDGHLEEGRRQIEIAVALDPTNSLLRSYLGKAYYEENTPHATTSLLHSSPSPSNWTRTTRRHGSTMRS